MSTEEHPLLERASLLVPLNKLPRQRQTRVLEQSDVLDLRKKAVLFEQGDRDDFTFYLLEGELELYSDGSLIKRVIGGDGASFQPLAQLQPRQMSAIAKSKSQVLRLKRSLLEQLLSVDEEPAEETAEASGMEVDEIEVGESGDWLMKVLQSDLFTRIPPSNIQGLLDTLESTTFTSGQDVIRQGEPGDFYYIVQSGTCEVLRAGSQGKEIRLAQLGPGDTFGEEALISDAERNATVRMASDGELARLTKSDFEHLIKQPLLHAVERAEANELVAGGALWLDVRFEDEHQHNGLADSINIPLGMLRKRAAELDPETRYVAYCDTGGRAELCGSVPAGRAWLSGLLCGRRCGRR